jgi:hypothetical protein
MLNIYSSNLQPKQDIFTREVWTFGSRFPQKYYGQLIKENAVSIAFLNMLEDVFVLS